MECHLLVVVGSIREMVLFGRMVWEITAGTTIDLAASYDMLVMFAIDALDSLHVGCRRIVHQACTRPNESATTFDQRREY